MQVSERWQRIKDVLGAVDGLQAVERERVLDSMCKDDPELRQDVDSLLVHEDQIERLNEPVDRAPWMATQPQQIGPYRVERLIGAGGMGTVYLASRCDEQYHKQVAIKVIQALNGAGLERRFRTERQILASLEHPAIARMLDGGTLEDGRPYLVMEYVDGVPIDRFADEQNLTVEQILQLFQQVCSAVQYAHRNLIVHRDLKPGNILVSPAGEPRLLDFGIAKMLTGVVEADAENTRAFERLLTPSSASPEQVAGGPLTTASDVYSLGLLLYRMLTGTSAYAGARDFKTNPNAAILHYDPPRASRVPGISPQTSRVLDGDLDCILAKALEKEVPRRYQTVEELSTDIQRYLDGRPIRARRASRLYVARKFIRRNRFQVAVAVVLLVAISAGLTGTILFARRAERQRQLAVKRLEALRHISESMLFEFHDSIRDLPGSTQARALVVRRALEYLNELASEDSSDPNVQRDLAAAYVRIGTILAGERGAHLGGPDAMKTAAASYERALAIRRTLATSRPTDPALRKELLESLWDLASVRQQEGDEKAALRFQEQRLRVIQGAGQPQNPDLQYSLAATYAAMSDLQRAQGNYSEALAVGRQSLAIREQLLRADPQNRHLQRAVGLSHLLDGFALLRLNQYSEALEGDEKALSIFKTLAAADPTNTDLTRNTEVAQMNVCEMLARSGSPSQAVPHCQAAVQTAEAMYRADLNNVQALEDIASAYATLGFAFHQERQLAKALTWERRADTEFENAAAKDPDADDAASGHAEALLELASIEHALKDRMACKHLEQAVGLLEQIALRDPEDAITQSRLLTARHVMSCD